MDRSQWRLRKINLIIGVHAVKSSKQPFCDASHKGTEFTPVVYKAEETKKMFFCACKQTDGQPFCDGSHNKK
jgi:CDGSH-type Zn-finger protein